MLTKLQSAASRMKRFHEDETGDVVQSIAIGAVGVLLAAVIFNSMSSVVQGKGSNGMQGMFSNFIGGLGEKAGSFFGF